jgi:hypothetical protein
MILPMGRRLITALLFSGLLAACASPPPPTISPRLPSSAPSPADAAPAHAPPATARPAPQPGQIVNQPGRAVRALLGIPDLERREPPAEVWQYKADGCVLDITFYPHKDGEPAHAAYLESRTLEGAKLEPVACLSRLEPPRGQE